MHTSLVVRFEELSTCAELTADHAREATASADRMRSFLAWAARTARPEEGAPKTLLAIGRLAESSWIDGTLYIDITGDDAVTKVSIFADYGFGIRERLFPLARLAVPFDEFVRAIRIAPKLCAPLRGEHVGGSLILTPPDAELDGLDGGLENIAIAGSSLVDDPLEMLDDPSDGHHDPHRTAPPPPVGQIGDVTPLAPLAVTSPPPSMAITKPPPSAPEQSGIHTHPTVRRMVAIRPEALRSGNDD